jgi:hypothetical protein
MLQYMARVLCHTNCTILILFLYHYSIRHTSLGRVQQDAYRGEASRACNYSFFAIVRDLQFGYVSCARSLVQYVYYAL